MTSTTFIQLELACLFITFLLGAYNLAKAKSVIKSIVSFSILDTSLILIFLIKTSRSGDTPPIATPETLQTIVDPLPQAMMIMAILINAAIISVGLMMSIKLFHYHGSLDWDDIFERRTK